MHLLLADAAPPLQSKRMNEPKNKKVRLQGVGPFTFVLAIRIL